MKQHFLSTMALVVAIVGGAYAQDNIKSIPIGTALPAENVQLKDISGNDVVLRDVKKDQGLLVMFSCNTCPYVIKNQERTKEICNYARANGLGVILINSNASQRNGDDSYDAMKEYAKAQGYDWHYVMDDGTKVADAFGAARTPEVYVFDKNNKLVYKGAIDDNPENGSAVKKQHLKLAIDAVVKGQPVPVKESKSVGCGIKRL